MQQMQTVLNGGLVEQISKLDAAGRTLSDPNNWDGPTAAQFRDVTWPGIKTALDRTLIELDQLRDQLQTISSSRPAGDGPEERSAPRGLVQQIVCTTLTLAA